MTRYLIAIFCFLFYCYILLSIQKVVPTWTPVSYICIQHTNDGHAVLRVYLAEEEEGQPWAWSVMITPKIQRPEGYVWGTGACKTCAEAKEAAIKWLENRR